MSAPAPVVRSLTLRQRVPSRVAVPFFAWDARELRFLAVRDCAECSGLGCHSRISIGPNGERSPLPCDCVLSRIFRISYGKFVEIAEWPKFMRRVDIDRHGPNGYELSMPGEEYCADFAMLGRRTLTDEEYALFRMFFLEGWDREACVERLKLERNFYKRISLMEVKLGRAIGQTRPYSLYRVREYFGR